MSTQELNPVARLPAAADEPPARIAMIGVPTRNRPACLEACLVSHLGAGRCNGRSFAVVVIDDSDAPETRESNRRMLRSLHVRFGAEVSYAGPAEKARFVAALARETGLPDEVVRFGLIDDEGYSLATGGSRNALLLHAVGEPLLQVDDDTLGRLAAVPGALSGLAFSSKPDPTEFWFLPEIEPVPPAPFAEEDLFSLHEQLLGKRPGACLAGADADVDASAAGPGFLRRLEADDGRVLVTAAGVVGDSGMGSSLHLLTLEGPSRDRLLASEPVYRRAVARRRVLRAVTRPTVSDGAFCMALNLGLDNRRLLPPFLPVQRNQDGVFAAVLRCSIGGGFFGFLPRAVPHRPPSPRGDLSGDPWREAGRIQTGHLFQVLIGMAAPRPGHADTGRNLAGLGRALADLAASKPAHFEEVVRLGLRQVFSGWANRLEARLQSSGRQPAYWAEDVQRTLATLRQALTDPDFAVPWDLRQTFTTDMARERIQRLVGRYGQLLQAWPAMVEAGQALRGRGVRPAATV